MSTRLAGVAGAVVIGAMFVPLTAQQPAAPAPAAQTQPAAPPLRVYIRAGLKTHAEGQHDYPQFLADWSKLLTDRGAIVDGGLSFPSAEALAGTDVIVMYKGDAGYMTLAERMALEAFQKRGGGIVGAHDAICAEDPAWWASIFGGAKRHGEVNYTLEAPVSYTFTQPDHPITRGMTPFTITDEAFFLMTWPKAANGKDPHPGFQVLATAPMAPTPSAGTHANEVVPQIWTYERQNFGGQSSRAFVWMQGHNYANFANPQIQTMMLRGIAWAGKRPVGELTTPRPARGGGGGGRGGRAGGGGGREAGAPGAAAPGGARGN
jgi:type 1 glutamine amidotransferase